VLVDVFRTAGPELVLDGTDSSEGCVGAGVYRCQSMGRWCVDKRSPGCLLMINLKIGQ
jgi:hypothetical protein